MTALPLDETWLRAHPLPRPDSAGDKNGRGRVLVAGGAEFVPGALRLTGEAALRAGAGKLQMATVRSAAMSLGVLIPEAAMIALPADENGEIAPEAATILADRLDSCDAMILGPGMSVGTKTDQLVADLLAAPTAQCPIVLDAAALTSARRLEDLFARREGRIILTPHHGEMAHLCGIDIASVDADPESAAARAARLFQAIILLKGQRTVLADREGQVMIYSGGCVGLATSGSGDVLAGIVGGLTARGACPFEAAAWGAWLHGRAGQQCAENIGKIGFLARELLARIPGLLTHFE